MVFYLFQSVNHGLFRVHALRLLMDESFGQHARVEFLEDVLVVDVLEDRYALR